MKTVDRAARFRSTHTIWVAAPALALLATLDVHQHYDESWSSAGLVGALFGAVLVLCTRFRRLGWLIALALVTGLATSIHPISNGEPWPWTVTSTVLISVATAIAARQFTRAKQLGAVWLLDVVCASVPFVLVGNRGSWANVALNSGILAVILGAVAAFEQRNAARSDALLQAGIAEEERRNGMILTERARIARELHDIVAHHMSIIAVQSQSAPLRLVDLSDDTIAEFNSLAGTARDTLTEMRRTLQVLRSNDADPALSPQPGIQDLSSLVETTSRVGVEVELNVDARALPPHHISGVTDLTVYRVVQEALSNVVRHAPHSSAKVEVSVESADLIVRVENDASRPTAVAQLGTRNGLGLIGMSERISMLSGALTAEPTPAGGFLVIARIPLSNPGGNGGKR